MDGIYGAGHINIAATWGPNSHAGPFQTQGDWPGFVQFRLMRANSEQPCACFHLRQSFRYRVHHDMAEEGVGALPLLTRAWVFQERSLATRTIHFTQEELFWECQRGRTCQCLPLAQINKSYIQTTKSLLRRRSNTAADRWLRAVESLSILQLTYETDRLPAIAGIVKLLHPEIQRIGGGTYFAGFWSNWLLEQPSLLLWQPGSRSPRQSHVHGPSWCWTARASPVHFLCIRMYDKYNESSDESWEISLKVKCSLVHVEVVYGNRAEVSVDDKKLFRDRVKLLRGRVETLKHRVKSLGGRLKLYGEKFEAGPR